MPRELWTLPILQDSRQQIDRSHLFPKITEGRWKWNVTVESGVALQTADYSLKGWTGRNNQRPGICVEWKKSIDELAGNLKDDDRDRFKREIARMLKFERRIIVVAQPREEIWNKDHSRNQWNPDSLMANIEAIEECGVAVKFFSGEPQAALYVTDMLRRFAEKKRELGEWEP